MKKMILAATAALAMLASCNKHTDEIADSATGSVVKITLTDKTPETRAFFDQTAAAESWEKKIKLPHAVRVRRQRGRRTATQLHRCGDFGTDGDHSRTGRRAGANVQLLCHRQRQRPFRDRHTGRPAKPDRERDRGL